MSMGCGCEQHTKASRPRDVSEPRKTRPQDQCEYCAEKHFSTAFALASENGYVAVNRQAIIGQLALAGWHLWESHRDLALKISALRHEIQHRNPVAEERWDELLSAIDILCNSESLRTQQEPSDAR